MVMSNAGSHPGPVNRLRRDSGAVEWREVCGGRPKKRRRWPLPYGGGNGAEEESEVVVDGRGGRGGPGLPGRAGRQRRYRRGGTLGTERAGRGGAGAGGRQLLGRWNRRQERP